MDICSILNYCHPHLGVLALILISTLVSTHTLYNINHLPPFLNLPLMPCLLFLLLCLPPFVPFPPSFWICFIFFILLCYFLAYYVCFCIINISFFYLLAALSFLTSCTTCCSCSLLRVAVLESDYIFLISFFFFVLSFLSSMMGPSSTNLGVSSLT